MTATDRPAVTGSTPAPGAADAPEGAAPSTPRWPSTIGMLLCVIGIGIASYLTYAHYTSPKVLACSDHGTIDCAKVTTSTYSHMFGMPVAVLGLAFFIGMLPLQLPVAWRSQLPVLRWARMGACVVGVVMILWLLYAELFKLDAICLYCTGVHVLTVLLFFSTALGTVATAQYAEDD